MQRHLSPRHMLEMTGPPAVAGAMAWLLCLLPAKVIDVLTVWTLLSLLPGMLFGRLALNED